MVGIDKSLVMCNNTILHVLYFKNNPAAVRWETAKHRITHQKGGRLKMMSILLRKMSIKLTFVQTSR